MNVLENRRERPSKEKNETIETDGGWRISAGLGARAPLYAIFIPISGLERAGNVQFDTRHCSEESG
jgi:hypothetical protein